MRVSIFSSFYPFRGGIAQFNAKLFRALEKEGHSLKAFTFIKQYPDILFPGKTQFVTEKDKADHIPAERVVSTFNPFGYFRAARKIKESNPDVFIANYWMSVFSIFLGIFANRLNKKSKRIAIVHNLIPHEPKFFDYWFNRFFVKRFDGFVVMSDKVKDDVLAMKPNAKILRKDHPWYDHFGELIDKNEALLKLSLDPNKKTILFFGLIRDYKGLDILIDAFNELDDTYQLVVAGEFYSKKDIFLEQIQRNKNRERILLSDRYIDDNEVPLFFSAADVCVLPYRTATQSGVTAASFHFGVPVIATNVGGLKESVAEKDLGIIIDEPDGRLLTQAIRNYFEFNLAPGFKKAIQNEKENHTWSSFAKEIVHFSSGL